VTAALVNTASSSSSSSAGFPLAGVANLNATELDLTVIARGPTRLSDATTTAVLSAPIPCVSGATTPSPRVSIVVVTHNNLVFTKLCVLGVLAHANPADYELIVVDNGSTDGTPQWLAELASINPHVCPIINPTNRGFAPANNQGLAAARGADVLVLLNNDTIVAEGWLDGLRRHLDDKNVGCVCACTNRIGNEAEVECSYRTLGEMLAFARRRAQEHAGEIFDLPMAPMFCFAMRRESFEKLGPIDEQYELGMFEDDDYAMRVRAAGLRVCCADDVFVHHFGGASFTNLLASGEHTRTFRANRERFEKKWSVAWTSHQRRTKPDYAQLIDQIRSTVAHALPRNSTIAVVSRGDEDLLKLEGQRAWHFPRLDDGQYAGHYPADGAEAIAHLEELRARGCEFFLIPQTSLWWLEHYAALADHLAAKYARCETRDADGCVIFDLAERTSQRRNADEHWQDRHLRELAEAILAEGTIQDHVLVPQRLALCGDQLGGLRLIVRRENVGAIYERVRPQ
jgi:GT2 family glycosyltransferase